MVPGPYWVELDQERDCAHCESPMREGAIALYVHGTDRGRSGLSMGDVIVWYCALCVCDLWPGRFGADRLAVPDWLTVQDDTQA